MALLVLTALDNIPLAEARGLQPSRWSPTEIVASRMVGTHLDEEIHTARIPVGTDPRELLLVIDFARNNLVISSAPSDGAVAGDVASANPADWSSSYSAAGGGSDLIQLSGRGYRVPVSVDSTATVAAGCPSCHGVLGVGPGSPLWLVWNRATFSAGAITLGHKQPQVKGSGRARIACQPLQTDLCVSRATVFGAGYDVRFQFRSAYTVVPAHVFDAYVGTRSVSNTPVEDWPSLRLQFRSANFPVDPRRPVLKIAPQSLIGDSRTGGARTLLLKRSTDPNSQEIVLGRTVWRSLMLYREFDTGRAILQTFDSTKRFPVWGLVSAVVVALLLLRWWTTRDALFYEAVPGHEAETTVLASSNRVKRIRGYRVPVGIFMPSQERQQQLQSANTRVWVGNTSAPWGPFNPNVYPGEWGVYPDRLFIELLAIGASVATLYIPALRQAAESKFEFWIFLQVAVYVMVVWIGVVWALRLAGMADAFGVLHYFSSDPVLVGPGPNQARTTLPARIKGKIPRSFVVYRAGLIRQAAVDVLLSIALLMISTLTRTDSLGTTMIALATGILSGVTMYHFLAAMVHMFRFHYRYRIGERGQAIWALWILFMGLMLAAVASFSMAFVVIPFMQLHVTSANAGSYVLAGVTIYAAGMVLGFALVTFEADRMGDWLQRVRGLSPKPPSGHPLAKLIKSGARGLRQRWVVQRQYHRRPSHPTQRRQRRSTQVGRENSPNVFRTYTKTKNK